MPTSARQDHSQVLTHLKVRCVNFSKTRTSCFIKYHKTAIANMDADENIDTSNMVGVNEELKIDDVDEAQRALTPVVDLAPDAAAAAPELKRQDADHLPPEEDDHAAERKFSVAADYGRFRSVFGTINYADAKDHTDAHNLAMADCDELQGLPHLKYIVVGLECGPENHVWHIHFVAHTDSQWSFAQIKGCVPRANLSRIRSLSAAMVYVKKGGEVVLENGDAPHQGATDEQVGGHVMQLLQMRRPIDEIMYAHPHYFLRYSSGIASAARYIQPSVDIDEHKLRPWQQQRYDEFISEEPAPRRKINWVVDNYGNAGKSWFCLWCFKHLRGVEIFGNQKTADLAMIIGHDPKIFMFDYSCCQGEVINYGVIEDVKNGFIVSGKYASCRKIFARPHVLCLSNFEPDRSKFMPGRLHIIRLSRLHGAADANHGDDVVIADEDL